MTALHLEEHQHVWEIYSVRERLIIGLNPSSRTWKIGVRVREKD